MNGDTLAKTDAPPSQSTPKLLTMPRMLETCSIAESEPGYGPDFFLLMRGRLLVKESSDIEDSYRNRVRKEGQF
jgi:hypothetical protein